ncbi:MAG: ribbon-helix-helix domain-containing protein [Candidatus Dormibacteraceae bacterium]
MQRITMSLPDDLATSLRRKARQSGLSVSGLIQQALRPQFAPRDTPRSLPIAGLGRSGFSTTAQTMEELLKEEWGN